LLEFIGLKANIESHLGKTNNRRETHRVFKLGEGLRDDKIEDLLAAPNIQLMQTINDELGGMEEEKPVKAVWDMVIMGMGHIIVRKIPIATCTI